MLGLCCSPQVLWLHGTSDSLLRRRVVREMVQPGKCLYTGVEPESRYLEPMEKQDIMTQ